jgi:hypothetical protein
MKPFRAFLAATAALAALPLAATAYAKGPAPAPAPAGTGQISSYILLDRTGSMQDIWAEALSSVNAYATEMATPDGSAKVDADLTVATFDAQQGLQFDVIRDSMDARKWKKVTDADATPRGMTPLYDAIGRIVSLAETEKPARAVIVIMTDGKENASQEVTREGAKAALDRARAKGWEVVFLGAEFANFDDATGVGQTNSRNMAVSKEQLSDSMNRLAQKSKDYANGASGTIEWTAEDRAAAQEEDVKQRTGQQTTPNAPRNPR